MIARIALPLIGALAAALVAALLALWWSVTSHAETRAKLDLAVDYIQARKDTDDALAHVPDDPDAILDGLLECANGGDCFGNP